MNSEPADKYLVPVVSTKIRQIFQNKPVTLLDIGCGDGYAAAEFKKQGHQVRAFDASKEDVETARARYPGIAFDVRSVYDANLKDLYAPAVDCVTTLEVAEHLYYPKRLFEQSFRLLRPGGWLILTTPYHGYVKNLALSLLNGWDKHFGVDWDGGHIKFFSNRALARMARDAGFHDPKFSGIGRVPFLWKSTIMVAQK